MLLSNKNNQLLYATTSMNLKSFMLKERRQTQETPYCIISFTENLDKAKPNYSDETKHDCFSQSLSHRGSAGEILTPNS